MPIIHVNDENTGEILEVDTTNPSGYLYIRDNESGDFVYVNLSSPSGIINTVDANSGDILPIDISNPSGILSTLDADTGDLVDINLSNPSGTLSVLDADSGDSVELNLSTDKFFSTNGLIVVLSGNNETPPTAPTGLVASPISTTRIDLSWTDVATNETGYKVFRSTNGVTFSQVGSTLPAGTESYSDTSVIAGQSYTYKVAASNGGGDTFSSTVNTNTILLGLIDYWKLDETTGNRLNSVSSRNMAPVNTVTSVAGKIGNAVSIASSPNYMTVVDANLTSLDWASGFSVWGWLYVPSPYSGRNTILSKADGAAADWILYSDSVSSLQMYVADSVSGDSIAVETTSLTLDAYHFFAGRYNSSTKKAELQIDGGTWRVAGNTLANGPKNIKGRLNIGMWGGLYGKAYYDEVGLSMRYLTNEEVAALYAAGAGATYPF